MPKRRLLWQFYVSYLLLALAPVAAVTWYAFSSLEQFYRDRTQADLEARALLVADEFRRALAAGDDQRVDALCKSLGAAAETRITVVRPDGKVVGDSEAAPASMENHADRAEIAAALDGETGASLHYSYTLQQSRLYVAIPLREADAIVGALRTSVSMSSIAGALAAIRQNITLVCLFVAVLVAGVSLLVSRRILRPLEDLSRGAKRFAAGDLTSKLATNGSREIGALADTLNQMAATLSERIGDLVQQRNEREAILSSMVEGVLAVDSQERLLRLNQAAAAFIGVDPERAAGRTLQEVVRNPALQQLVTDVLTSHQSKEDEIMLRRNGERHLHVQGTVLRNACEEAGALVVLHEVTQLRRLEKVRRDFVANVSHELRTPVTSIKGFVETLLDGAMHNPDELQRFLRIVATQTDRLNAIIEDLLTLSRIEEDEEKAEIVLAEHPLHSVLAAAVEVCGMKAAEKGIRLEVTCDRALQAAVNAPLLEQAVINLVDNAIKYSPSGETVQLGALRCGGEVVISVSDHGSGIGREHLARIFERFYRVDKARSRKLGGTGLGLAIVKHIALAHGGRATVESVVGQGSTFSIHIPAVVPAAQN